MRKRNSEEGLKKVRSWAGFLFLLGLVSRLVTASRFPISHDSVEFCFALEMDRPPHFPFYPGYVLLGKLLKLATGEVHFALLMLSALSTGATAIFLYLLAREIGSREEALFSCLLFLTSPLVWFNGSCALTYLPEAAILAGFLLVSLKRLKREGPLWPVSLYFLLLTVVRPDDFLLFGPLWAVVTFREREGWKQALLWASAASSILLFTLKWARPAVEAGSVESVIRFSVAKVLSVENLGRFALCLLEGFSLALFLALVGLTFGLRGGEPKVVLLLHLSLWPPCLFHALVSTGWPGMLTRLFLPLSLLAARGAGWLSGLRRGLGRVIVFSVAIVHGFYFLIGPPGGHTWASLREHDRAFEGCVEAHWRSRRASVVIVPQYRHTFSPLHAAHLFGLPVICSPTAIERREEGRLVLEGMVHQPPLWLGEKGRMQTPAHGKVILFGDPAELAWWVRALVTDASKLERLCPTAYLTEVANIKALPRVNPSRALTAERG